jgi:hypothetical protein
MVAIADFGQIATVTEAQATGRFGAIAGNEFSPGGTLSLSYWSGTAWVGLASATLPPVSGIWQGVATGAISINARYVRAKAYAGSAGFNAWSVQTLLSDFRATGYGSPPPILGAGATFFHQWAGGTGTVTGVTAVDPCACIWTVGEAPCATTYSPAAPTATLWGDNEWGTSTTWRKAGC